MPSKDYRDRLEKIIGLAKRLEELKSDFQDAAALHAGFPVKITAIEVELAVEFLKQT